MNIYFGIWPINRRVGRFNFYCDFFMEAFPAEEHMILSVSRRTDIPHYYSKWFLNRLEEGFLLVPNPMNPKQISQIGLTPEEIECIVFWTKNPEPMFSNLEKLSRFAYYFQFTLTGYNVDVEPVLGAMKNELIKTFVKFANQIGSERMVWRYDPILLNDFYSVEYHIRTFEKIAERLSGSTDQCIVSFYDDYQVSSCRVKALNLVKPNVDEKKELLAKLSQIAGSYNIRLTTCAENGELGISAATCVDPDRIRKVLGQSIKGQKDRNQRELCNCIESADIGMYHTCPSDCLYCYANHRKLLGVHDPSSPLLWGYLPLDAKISKRASKKVTSPQGALF